MPDGLVCPEGDPAELAVARETVRLAFVAALQHLPPRQRAVLVLCEVLRWQAPRSPSCWRRASPREQRAAARAGDARGGCGVSASPAELDGPERELLERYVQAFEAYDIDALTSLLHEDATQSMPPFDLWLSGRDDILTWWFGPGIGCRGSRLLPTVPANGSPAFGQYKPAPGGGYEPWALQVIEIEVGRVVELTFFLDTAPCSRSSASPCASTPSAASHNVSQETASLGDAALLNQHVSRESRNEHSGRTLRDTPLGSAAGTVSPSGRRPAPSARRVRRAPPRRCGGEHGNRGGRPRLPRASASTVAASGSTPATSQSAVDAALSVSSPQTRSQSPPRSACVIGPRIANAIICGASECGRRS